MQMAIVFDIVELGSTEDEFISGRGVVK